MIATVFTLLATFPVAWIIAAAPRGRPGSLLFIICLVPLWVSETAARWGG
ncbi:MAG: hypothetical protein U1F35_13865 [Steroidobacteraceae bacterium]